MMPPGPLTTPSMLAVRVPLCWMRLSVRRLTGPSQLKLELPLDDQVGGGVVVGPGLVVGKDHAVVDGRVRVLEADRTAGGAGGGGVHQDAAGADAQLPLARARGGDEQRARARGGVVAEA